MRRPSRAFLDNATLHVEALNRALGGIPPEKVRVHLCWGNYEGPHHHDVALKDIVEVVLKVHAMGISFVAANPRHEHEWKVWNKVALPDDKVLIPGVIDTTSNIIEHSELVAERIVRFAELVGPKRVIAGTDCLLDLRWLGDRGPEHCMGQDRRTGRRRSDRVAGARAAGLAAEVLVSPVGAADPRYCVTPLRSAGPSAAG